MPSLVELRRTERSPEFEHLCMNRKVVGSLRYGRMGDPNKPKYDRARDMIRRLELYLKDGNAEWLVDVANIAELEFVEGNHHGVTSVDDGIHTAEMQ